MWWMIPVVVGGLIVKKVVDDKKKKNTISLDPKDRKTILEQNFERLHRELPINLTGKVVAIIGQPGAGKSSFLDSLTEGKSNPRPEVGVKTDQTNWSNSLNIDLIHIFENNVYIDAPGYNTKTHPTQAFLSKFPFGLFDKIILVVGGKIHESDEQIWRVIMTKKSSRSDVLVVRTFSENLNDEEKEEVFQDLSKKLNAKLFFVSNRFKSGIREVREFLQNS